MLRDSQWLLEVVQSLWTPKDITGQIFHSLGFRLRVSGWLSTVAVWGCSTVQRVVARRVEICEGKSNQGCHSSVPSFLTGSTSLS